MLFSVCLSVHRWGGGGVRPCPVISPVRGSLDRTRGPPQTRQEYPFPQLDSTRYSHYAAGGTPLTVTQEDFLVLKTFRKLKILKFC